MIKDEGVGIDINFPSDATVMFAMLRDTFEIVVVVWFDCFHSSSIAYHY